MSYKDLRTRFHTDGSSKPASNIERLAYERRTSDSSFPLGFAIPAGELFLAVPRELNALTQRVLRRERKITKLLNELPGLAGHEVLRGLVLNEIVSSNSIENIHSTRKQIEEALRSQGKEDLQAKRFREFAKLYIDIVYGEYSIPETPQDVREIYDKAMAGEKLDDVPDGELFRAGPVVIENGMREIHAGIEPESAIVEAIEAMIALTRSPEVPELYSAIASHFIFEYAHPFYDGNGRLGRYLLSMYLEVPLSKPTTLSLSRIIAENKSEYYRAFDQAEDPMNHGELTFFVMRMLEFILKAQDQLIEGLEENVGTLQVLRQKARELEASGSYSEREISMLFALLQRRAFGVNSSVDIETLSTHAGVGVQQTRKYLNALEKAGDVVKTRGRSPMLFAVTDAFLEEHGIKKSE